MAFVGDANLCYDFIRAVSNCSSNLSYAHEGDFIVWIF